MHIGCLVELLRSIVHIWEKPFFKILIYFEILFVFYSYLVYINNIPFVDISTWF